MTFANVLLYSSVNKGEAAIVWLVRIQFSVGDHSQLPTKMRPFFKDISLIITVEQYICGFTCAPNDHQNHESHTLITSKNSTGAVIENRIGLNYEKASAHAGKCSDPHPIDFSSKGTPVTISGKNLLKADNHSKVFVALL